MLVNALVDDVVTKAVKDKFRPGGVKNTYVVSAGGFLIDFGFKLPPVRKGEMLTVEVSDGPNKWGKHEVVGPASIGAPALNTTGPVPQMTVRKDPVSKSFSFPIPKSDHATGICRQNALTAAVGNYVNNRGNGAGSFTATVDDVLNIASQFARWTTGQAEVAEAERILAEELAHDAPNA